MAHKIPIIDLNRCSGCGWCLATCRDRLLAFAPLGWRKVTRLNDAGQCNGCSKCAAKCPTGAIQMLANAPESCEMLTT